MKKRFFWQLLSIVLTVAMVVTSLPFGAVKASAAAPTSYTNITEGQTKTVTISTAGTSVYFRFVPQYSGTYTFRSSDSGDPYGYLLNSSGSVLTSDDDSGSGSRDFRFTYNCTAGTIYYLQAKLYDSTATGSFTVSITGTAPTIAAGQSKAVTISSGGSYVDYLFVPTVTGTYTFESSNYTGDPHGYLLNSSKSQLVSNDDGGTNYNFRFTYNCTAGTTYYLRAAMHTSTATGSYTVSVAAPTGDVVQIVAGTSEYHLFNSGCTGDAVYLSSNPAPHTYTNNNYDLYGQVGSASTRRFRLGRSFTVNTTLTQQAILSIRAYDVDEDAEACGHGYEYDYIDLIDETAGTTVRLDGHMSGQNNTWNNSTFRIDPSLLQQGHTYHFELYMTCTGSSTCGYYSVKVRSVSLEAVGLGSSTIVDANLSASVNASGLVSVTLNARSSVSSTYTLEYKAVHAGTNAQKGGKEYSVTIPTQSTNLSTTFQLESGYRSGTYSVTVFIKDGAGNVVATRETTFSVDGAAVSYNANGGTQNIPQDLSDYVSGDTVTVLFDYVPSKTGYVFLGWARSSTATSAEFTATGTKTFTIGADDVTLYAVWQAEGAAPDADVWDGTISTGFGGGTGTSTNPYLIYTAEQLAYLASSTNSGTTYSGKYFKLMANIDLANREWTPIGKGGLVDDDFSNITKTFRGYFDGAGHIIFNLRITSAATSCIGLFGATYGGYITNLGIENAVVHIEQTGSNRAMCGALIGYAKEALVEKCFVKNADISSSTPGSPASAGCLIGILDVNGTIRNCYAQGTAYASGGHASVLVGGQYHSGTVLIENCYVIGTAEADSSTSSGIVVAGGMLANIGGVATSFKNDFFVGSVTSDDRSGTISGDGGGTVTNSYYSITSITGSAINRNGASTAASNFKSQSWITTNLGWDFTNVWTFVSGYDYPVLQGFNAVTPEPAPEPAPDADVWDGTVATGFGGGTGTSADPYLIYTAEQLAYLASSTNSGTTYSGKYFKLMANIDLANREWTPIGKGIQTGDTYTTTNAFHGNFDGNGHIIYNLKISSSTTSFTGFFGCLYSATVRNLGIENASVRATGISSSYRCTAGILAGASKGGVVIDRCYTVGTLSATGNCSFLDMGCLVGDYYNSTVTDCYAVGNVSEISMSIYNNGFVGGLFGFAEDGATASRCFYIGNVAGSSCEIDAIAYVETPFNFGNCYYLSNLSSDYGRALTAAQFTTQSSFTNFDFVSDWEMGAEHPVLRGFDRTAPVPHEHTEGEPIVDTEATCAVEGQAHTECTDCGEIMSTTVIPKIPHTEGPWKLETKPTPAAAGTKVKYCTVCGEVVERQSINVDEYAIVRIDTPATDLIIGEEVTFTVTVEGTDPLEALVLIPSFDTNYFEFVDARWVIAADETDITAGTLYSVANWDLTTDVNTAVYTITLRAKALTAGTSVDFTAAMYRAGELIAPQVVGKTIPVITCPHASVTCRQVDGTYHEDVCARCGDTQRETHSFDNACDESCDRCGYTRTITHSYEAVWSVDSQEHWHRCTVCGDTTDRGAHTYTTVGSTCDTCGYVRYLLGDVDVDGDVDSDDAIYLLYHTTLAESYPVNQRCDFNGDGNVDSDDVIHLLCYSFFAVRYPLHDAP